MKNKAALLFLVIAVLLGGGAWLWMSESWKQAPAPRNLPVNTLLGGDFTLPSTEGREISLQAFRGKVVLLNFGFTYCPDVCPTVLQHMAFMLADFDKAGIPEDQVVPVFVTFDPERDTVERLREYLGFFSDRFIGFTGTAQQIEKVAKQYGVVYLRNEEESALEYSFSHSDFIYLIDKQGRVRKLFKQDVDRATLVEDVKYLLDESPDI